MAERQLLLKILEHFSTAQFYKKVKLATVAAVLNDNSGAKENAKATLDAPIFSTSSAHHC